MDDLMLGKAAEMTSSSTTISTYNNRVKRTHRRGRRREFDRKLETNTINANTTITNRTTASLHPVPVSFACSSTCISYGSVCRGIVISNRSTTCNHIKTPLNRTPPTALQQHSTACTKNCCRSINKAFYTTCMNQHAAISPSWSTAYRILTIIWLIGVLSPLSVYCVDPKFDPSTRMRLVLVPSDAQVGSVIYRLRATDEEFDYPLTFELVGEASTSTVKIESLPCTKYNSVCQANVVLQRRLEPGRYYDFQVTVQDTKGGTVTQLCSITATNFSTPHDLIFPHKPTIIMIPEVSVHRKQITFFNNNKISLLKVCCLVRL